MRFMRTKNLDILFDIKRCLRNKRKNKSSRGIYLSGYFNEVEIAHPMIYLNSNEEFEEKNY